MGKATITTTVNRICDIIGEEIGEHTEEILFNPQTIDRLKDMTGADLIEILRNAALRENFVRRVS